MIDPDGTMVCSVCGSPLVPMFQDARRTPTVRCEDGHVWAVMEGREELPGIITFDRFVLLKDAGGDLTLPTDHPLDSP